LAETETKEKRSISRIIIIVLLVIMMLMMSATLFFVILQSRSSEAGGPPVMALFQPETGEYTFTLEEFIVNLKQDKNSRNYIKISLALMYTDEKSGQTIDSNVSKIRDVIINTLRSKTYNEVLDESKTAEIKKQLVENINTALGESIVEGVYITDVLVQ